MSFDNFDNTESTEPTEQVNNSEKKITAQDLEEYFGPDTIVDQDSIDDFFGPIKKADALFYEQHWGMKAKRSCRPDDWDQSTTNTYSST